MNCRFGYGKNFREMYSKNFNAGQKRVSVETSCSICAYFKEEQSYQHQ